jgi:hypothetical protein
MTIADDIIAARGGWTDCGISTHRSPSLVQLADEFSLATDVSIYREIDATEARRLVERLLHKDLVHGAQRIKPARAAELADGFLAQFGTEGTHYFTNSRFNDSGSIESWNSATDSTFDAGILVVGPLCSGFLWIEEED